MSELTEAFKMIMKRKRPSENLLVPLLRWCSAREADIELCQRINKRFFKGNRKLYIRELSLSNTVSHFMPYPKGGTTDSKLDFFYKDLAKYLGWTTNEINKSLDVLDLEGLKTIVASQFGYDNKERKAIGLPKLEGLSKYVKRR